MVMLKALAPFAAVILLAALAQWLLPAPNQSYVVYVGGLAAINVLLAVSLNIVNGFAGQFSLGHAGFMAAGGYSAAIFSLHVAPSWQVPEQLTLLLGCLIGGSLAGSLGILVGIPSLKLRGDYLAIVTLGFGEIVRVLIENIGALGGATGLVGIPPLTSIFWLILWAGLSIVLALRLAQSSHGRALFAIRDDEVAAAAMGINTTGYKVRAFAFSAALAGVAGALLGHYLQLLSPKDFTFVRSIEIVTMIVLGGLGSVAGAIVGGLVLTVLPEGLRMLQPYTGGVDFRIVVYALLLVITMILRPQGLFGRPSQQQKV